MTSFAGHPLATLTEIYIEALLVDEELADQVGELWDAGLISDDLAAWAWWSIFSRSQATTGDSKLGRPNDYVT